MYQKRWKTDIFNESQSSNRKLIFIHSFLVVYLSLTSDSLLDKYLNKWIIHNKIVFIITKQKSAYFLFPPLCCNSWFFRYDLFLPNSTVIFCHSQISLVCLIYLSLPNLYFCIIRSMIMFLKVLNKVNIRTLIQP